MICGEMRILDPLAWCFVRLRLDSLEWGFRERLDVDVTSFMTGGNVFLSRQFFLTIGPIPVVLQTFSVSVPMGILLLQFIK